MLTRKLFDSIFPTKGLNPKKYNLVRERDLLIETLNEVLPRYGITTFMRICAFLGNCGIETDYFKTTVEYASGEDYEWRKSLGNVIAGDGRKFKGRGLTQTTGRYNYNAVNKTYGKLVGIDFIAFPESLAEVRHAVESACVFWDDHKLNAYADRGEFKQLSAIVNRGDKNLTPLHWAKRNELYSKCKRMIPRDFGLVPDPIVTATFQNGSVITTSVPTFPNGGFVGGDPTQTNPSATAGTDKIGSSDSQFNASGSVSLKEAANKYLKHCPTDKLKNVLMVVAGRVIASITSLWGFLGIHGQILLIVGALVLLFFAGRALWVYRERVGGWAKDILDGIFE